MDGRVGRVVVWCRVPRVDRGYLEWRPGAYCVGPVAMSVASAAIACTGPRGMSVTLIAVSVLKVSAPGLTNARRVS